MAAVDNLVAYVSAGRWVVDCPKCNSALDAKTFGIDRRLSLFGCIECGHGFDETVWHETVSRMTIPIRTFALRDLAQAMRAPVVWTNDIEAIELALLRRNYSVWQNWRPGMTVQELVEAEPFLHFSWTAPMTYTAGAVLTAGQQNTYVRDNSNETSPAKATAAADTFYASAANAIVRLAKGTAYQGLGMNIGVTAPEWQDRPAILDHVTTEVEVVTTSVETQVYSFSVAANLLGTNNALRLTLWGSRLNNNTDNATLTVNLYYGGTKITTYAPSVGLSATRIVDLDLFALKGDAATNAQRGMAVHPDVGGSGAKNNEGTAAIVSTAAQTLAVKVQHSVSNVNHSYIMREAVLEYLRNV